MIGPHSRGHIPLVATVLLILLASSVPVGGAAHSPDGSRPAGPATTAVNGGSPTPGAPSAASGSSAARSTGPGAGSPLVDIVEHQISERLFNGRDAFLPSPYVHTGTLPRGAVVAPAPLQSPGPMGLADLGIGTAGQPYEYNTSAFVGSVHLASYRAYSPGYAEFADAPNWTTIQLNAVGVNLSYPGSTAGTFWFQNVVHFNGDELQFEDNIWNFTSPTSAVTRGTLYSHGPTGQVERAEFYFAYGPTYRVSYPFTLSLALQLAVVGGRPAAFFNYTIANGSGTTNGSYDEVIFNGPAANPPQFRVDGSAYDPFGDEYDTELTFGGDGGGRNANLVALNGSAVLSRWNSSAGVFQHVPSAYDHGVDSGETTTGIAAYYLSNRSATEHLDQGPSFLYGLWNTTTGPAGPSARPGYIRADVSVSPAYAFLFATNLSDSSLPLAKADYAYSPSDESGVSITYLPPPTAAEPYVFTAWADGFGNGSVEVTQNASLVLSLSAARGTVDAPVYLDGDSQTIALGTHGFTGTVFSPLISTLWINQTQAAVAPPFLRVNGFDYPLFVLFAAQDLNLTLGINGFVQASSSSVYTSSYTFLPLPGAGWSQGYYFFSGAGKFTVSNTTLTGNSTLYYDLAAPPAAVEFYGTTGSTASNILARQESFGVEAVDATGLTVHNLTSVQGANALSLVNSTQTTATSLATVGTDYTEFSSLGAYVYHSTYLNVSGLVARNGSYGLFAQSSSGITLSNVVATTAGIVFPTVAVLLNATDFAEVHHLRANASIAVIANDTAHTGYYDLATTLSSAPSIWSNSSHLIVNGLAAANGSSGGRFLNDTQVAVDAVSAVAASVGIEEFANSTGGAITGVSASGGSFGLNATGSPDLVVTGISATGGSVGAYLANDTGATVSQISASNGSTGLLANSTSGLGVRDVTASGASLGAELSNSSGFTVRWANASEPTLVGNASYYSFDPLTFRLQPTAAVALYDDANGTVTNVSAHNYPFAVWANFTNFTDIEGISAWDGYQAVALNGTDGVVVASVFAYGNFLGVYLANTTDTLVSASTLEASVSYGVEVDNGTLVWVDANNFVANNGANTKGTFQAAHTQAHVINGTRIYFNATGGGFGNFWSDHSGAASYIVRSSPSVVDKSPVGAVIHHWLEFEEAGLPALTVWGFTLLETNYSASVPLVYIPSWSLPRTPLGFVVVPPAGYVPRPGMGSVTLAARSNVTVVINFAELYTVTFTETGLPARTAWSVALNGTSEGATGARTTLTFNESAGSYPYTVAVVPGWKESTLARTGTVVVTTGNVNEKTIAWVQAIYDVTFTESGLPSKTKWTVTLNGSPASANGTSIAFKEPNGTYPYVVSTPAGYLPVHSHGSVVVNGADAAVSAVFNSTSSSPSSSFPWIYVGVGGGAAVVLVAALALVLRSRRKRRPPEAPFEP